MLSAYRKQKRNTKISTEVELFAVDYVSVYILWKVLFIEFKGCNIDKNIFYQDKNSSIMMVVYGKRSVGKRIQELNIHYFFMKDQVEK